MEAAPNQEQRRPWFLSPLACFAWGALLVLGLCLVSNNVRRVIIGETTEVREGGYRFISPLLECEQAGEAVAGSKYNFRARIEREMSDAVNNGSANTVAVYYRDLTNGPWLGVNSNDAYFPASLLKVPVSMATLKMAEDDPAFLERKVTASEPYKLPPGRSQLVAPSQSLEVGREYTVRELIEATLKHSDNHALALLYTVLDTAKLVELYERLGVPTDVLYDTNATLSVRNYATFFRILYNSSFLSREYSEMVLEFLSQADFTAGIVAGTPAAVTVSHKFGEAGTTAEHQLHDCGIVYHPKYPYIICVMARGSSLEGLQTTIQDVSRATYAEVSRFE